MVFKRMKNNEDVRKLNCYSHILLGMLYPEKKKSCLNIHAVSFLYQKLFLIKYLMIVQNKGDWVQSKKNIYREQSTE